MFAVAQTLLSKNSASYVLVRMIGGLFLAFTVISPMIDVDLDTLFQIPFDFVEQGNTFAAQGKQISDEYLNAIIKDRCETYILDKATFYHADIEVEVTLSNDAIPVPAAVRIQGQISPYAKKAMQKWLADNMEIPEENQVWIG